MSARQPDAVRNLRGVTLSRAVMAERQRARARASRDEMRSHRGTLEAPGTRRQPGHSSRTLAVATQVNYGRPSDAPSGFPVTVSLRRPGQARPGSSRLVALYLYAPATATLPMEVDARLPRSGPGILLHYSGGRACDERRQIAAGTRWINLLSISSVTSPQHSRSRIVAPHYTLIILRRARPARGRTLHHRAVSNPKRGAKLLDGPDVGVRSSCDEIKTAEHE